MDSCGAARGAQRAPAGRRARPTRQRVEPVRQRVARRSPSRTSTARQPAAWAACRSAGRVADHQQLRRAPRPGAAQAASSMPGEGLRSAGVSAPCTCVEEGQQAGGASSTARASGVGLLVTTTIGSTRCRPRQQRRGCRGRRCPQTSGAASVATSNQRRSARRAARRRRRARPCCAQRAHDQRIGPVADPAAHGVELEALQPGLLQRRVQRVLDVRRAVDQRAVEVEGDGRGSRRRLVGHARSRARRCWPASASSRMPAMASA